MHFSLSLLHSQHPQGLDLPAHSLSPHWVLHFRLAGLHLLWCGAGAGAPPATSQMTALSLGFLPLPLAPLQPASLSLPLSSGKWSEFIE